MAELTQTQTLPAPFIQALAAETYGTTTCRSSWWN